MMYKAFSRKLFGVNHERLRRTLPVCLLVFCGLRFGEFRVLITPSILHLMVSTFTGGVMWQALSSKDNAGLLQNMLMLPLDGRKFVLSYTAALGLYAVLTKTAMLLAVVLAVSAGGVAALSGSIICAVHAVLLTACFYGWRKYWYVYVLWIAVMTAAVLYLGESMCVFALLAGSSMSALMLLLRMDGYAFYGMEKAGSRTRKSRRHALVWRYLFRYLTAHKNYLINTMVLWGGGCVLPFFFREMESRWAVPVGFAVLSLNTPMGILLSCDPGLLQAVRSLPDGRRRFSVPYCLFFTLCNLMTNSIFLINYQLQTGGAVWLMMEAAVFFALQSAVCSVLLEWYHPILDWRIESDLWHHPRKYVVPAVMLLLAGAVGTVPALLPALLLLPAAGMALLLF